MEILLELRKSRKLFKLNLLIVSAVGPWDLVMHD
jgi:hypothetical protein